MITKQQEIRVASKRLVLNPVKLTQLVDDYVCDGAGYAP